MGKGTEILGKKIQILKRNVDVEEYQIIWNFIYALYNFTLV